MNLNIQNRTSPIRWGALFIDLFLLYYLTSDRAEDLSVAQLICAMAIGTLAHGINMYGTYLERQDALSRVFTDLPVVEIKGVEKFSGYTLLYFGGAAGAMFNLMSYPSYSVYPYSWVASWFVFVVLVTIVENLWSGYRWPSIRLILFQDRIILFKDWEREIFFIDLKEFTEDRKGIVLIGDDNTKIEIRKREFSSAAYEDFYSKLKVVVDYWEKKKAYSYKKK